jgi:hypothetical protein
MKRAPIYDYLMLMTVYTIEYRKVDVVSNYSDFPYATVLKMNYLHTPT